MQILVIAFRCPDFGFQLIAALTMHRHKTLDLRRKQIIILKRMKENYTNDTTNSKRWIAFGDRVSIFSKLYKISLSIFTKSC
nr:MAG TPA: hypothetical protein [Caudoviricetes sp.]